MQTKDVVPVLLSPITKTFGFVESMVVLGYAIANKMKGRTINGRTTSIDDMMEYLALLSKLFGDSKYCVYGLGLKPLMAGVCILVHRGCLNADFHMYSQCPGVFWC
jgi:hypothetical protein